MNNQKMKTFLQVSILKTLRFNLHYFGKQGLKCPVIVSRNVRFLQMDGTVACAMKPRSVFLGFGNPGIADRSRERIIFQNSGKIVFEGSAFFSPGCKIVNSGTLTFGNGFDIKARSEIVCEQAVSFGENALISWDCLIMDTDMHTICCGNGQRVNEARPVRIGKDVWVGCRATILKGVTVPDGCIIGSGSVVRRKLDDQNSIYINDQPVKKDIHWEK